MTPDAVTCSIEYNNTIFGFGLPDMSLIPKGTSQFLIQFNPGIGFFKVHLAPKYFFAYIYLCTCLKRTAPFKTKS